VLPKPNSSAGDPHAHLGWDRDIWGPGGRCGNHRGVRWDSAWDQQAQSQVQGLQASIAGVWDL